MYVCVCIHIHTHTQTRIWTDTYLRYSLNILTLIFTCIREIATGEYNVVHMINCTPFCCNYLPSVLHQQINISLHKTYSFFIVSTCLKALTVTLSLRVLLPYIIITKYFLPMSVLNSLFCPCVWDCLDKLWFLQLPQQVTALLSKSLLLS